MQINPSDLSNDSDPVFMNEFYTNLRILSQDLYKHSQSKKSDGAAVHARRSSGHKVSLMRQLSGLGRSPSSSSQLSAPPSEQQQQLDSSKRENKGGAPTATHANNAAAARYFGADSMQERVKQYAQEGGIPSEFLDRYMRENDAAGGTNAP